jgi:flagella basal body P-ring formation protein FlgA
MIIRTFRSLALAALALVLPVAGVQAEPASPSPLTRDHVLSSLSRDLSAHFNFEGELTLELVRPWTPPAQVAVTWELAVLEYPSLPAASMLVRCRLLADGELAGDHTLLVRASLWRDVWVSRQPLTMGASFDASVLDVRRVDLLRERDALPAAVGDRSYIFSRALPAGRTLTWRDLARRPLVRKGELVEVSAADGMLLVTMKALAMENGAQGDVVTVRNPDSRKDFAAQVIDENRVQVRF